MNNSPTSEQSTTVLNQLVIDYLREQKRQRRWRWFKRACYVLFFGYLAYAVFADSRSEKAGGSTPHVGVIDLRGEIGDGQNVSSENFAKSLQNAYKNSGMKALILRINSPGGSPVQADYMYNLLQYYRKKYPSIKVYSVCADMCASAAYYVAVGTEEIYANPSSMVGSIGVIFNGFGFVDAMQKIGITRRLQTAGKNKGFMDPFSPETPEHHVFLQNMLDSVHTVFINRVKEGRGSRLLIDDQTFSGLVWAGEAAKQRGLIDGFASAGQLAREVIQVPQVNNYTYKGSLLERVSRNIGSAMANQLPQALGLKPELVS